MKFKVGDKVRFVDDGIWEGASGEVVEVRHLLPLRYRVYFDEEADLGQCVDMWIREEKLELVEEEPSEEQSSEGGLKFDDGKPPMSLLPFDALEEVAQVLAYGAKKYEEIKVKELIKCLKNVGVNIQIERYRQGGYVAHVTRDGSKKTAPNTKLKLLNIRKNTDVKTANDSKLIISREEEIIPPHLSKNLEKRRERSKENMESVLTNGLGSLKDRVEDVLYVYGKFQNFIRIIVIQQEKLEDSFVVSVTTGSAFLETLQMELRERWNISTTLKSLTKTGQNNWRQGFDWSRLYSGVLRHLSSHMQGIDKDEETGLSHLAHAACGILFLVAHEKNGLGTDDRYKGEDS